MDLPIPVHPQKPTARFTMLFELAEDNQTAHVTRPSVGTLESSTLGQIATSVASNGQTLNILDFSEWIRQQNKIKQDEESKGVKTVLCMPIVDGSKNIIGVTQLIDKVRDCNSFITFCYNINGYPPS